MTNEVTKIPTDKKDPEQIKGEKFQEMYTEFTTKAREETGYALMAKIGEDGPFITGVKLPTDETA